MAKARFGITICCEKDINYWDVKKQILDLQSILDPNPSLVNIPCTCWTITQIVGSGTYTYLSCAGVSTILNLTEGVTETVCSKQIPCASTISPSSSFRIEGLGAECTDNSTCQPG
jgi:hypothetical protein